MILWGRAHLICMADQPQLDPELISNYLAGETSPGDEIRIAAWLKENPANKAQLEDLAASWSILPYEETPVLDLEAFQRSLEQRTKTSPSRSRLSGWTTPLEKQWTMPGKLTYGRLAAVLVLLVAAWFGGSKRMAESLYDATSTYATANGERATVTLPDGSVVSLNVGSKLEVPGNYAAGVRTVRLSGEAVFIVTSRSGSPFTVLAGPSTTRVLGTTFMVRHYATDSVATIAVREGKVSVDDSVLTASQQISVGLYGMGNVKASSDASFSFMDGILTLENTPLRDAVQRLNRWYDAEVRIGDPSLDTREMTGEFSAGSLNELIEILEWTYNMRVVQSGRTLTLFPRG